MNYEKKYKEALERARDLMTNQNPPAFDKHLIEIVFPELKESEDERIRREIIDFLRLPHHQFSGKRDHEKWIAWLEKQSEHKPIDYENANIQQKDFAPKVEPKFQVGDKVTMKGDNTVYTIGIIAPDKTCWLKHGSREYGWATFGVLKHYVE